MISHGRFRIAQERARWPKPHAAMREFIFCVSSSRTTVAVLADNASADEGMHGAWTPAYRQCPARLVLPRHAIDMTAAGLLSWSHRREAPKALIDARGAFAAWPRRRCVSDLGLPQQPKAFHGRLTTYPPRQQVADDADRHASAHGQHDPQRPVQARRQVEPPRRRRTLGRAYGSNATRGAAGKNAAC